MLTLIRLLDDELLPVSKQKATQEFKDLSAGDEDNLAMVLLNFCNVGSSAPGRVALDLPHCRLWLRLLDKQHRKPSVLSRGDRVPA